MCQTYLAFFKYFKFIWPFRRIGRIVNKKYHAGGRRIKAELPRSAEASESRRSKRRNRAGAASIQAAQAAQANELSLSYFPNVSCKHKQVDDRYSDSQAV